MLEGDDAAAAAQQAGVWPENRARQWWDATRMMSRLLAQALGLHGPAWDVYLLYRPGTRWQAEIPPAPSFWMHQLSDPAADPARCLGRDPGRLSLQLETFLKG